MKSMPKWIPGKVLLYLVSFMVEKGVLALTAEGAMKESVGICAWCQRAALARYLQTK